MKNILRTCKRLSQSTAGFTMIELLVVISVIGILAVAVLSAINPIEQINKGRDTRARSDAGQLLSASERYFAIQELYPWNKARTSTTNNTDYVAGSAVFSTAFSFDGPTETNTSANWNWIFNLSDSQEVKDSFTARVKNESRFIVYRAQGDNSSTYVCFVPTSYAFKLEADKYCMTSPINGVTVGSTKICSTTTGSSPTVAGENNHICLP